LDSTIWLIACSCKSFAKDRFEFSLKEFAWLDIISKSAAGILVRNWFSLPVW